MGNPDFWCHHVIGRLWRAPYLIFMRILKKGCAALGTHTGVSFGSTRRRGKPSASSISMIPCCGLLKIRSAQSSNWARRRLLNLDHIYVSATRRGYKASRASRMRIGHVAVEGDVLAVPADGRMRLRDEIFVAARVRPCESIDFAVAPARVYTGNYDFVLIRLPIARCRSGETPRSVEPLWPWIPVRIKERQSHPWLRSASAIADIPINRGVDLSAV